jgi:predicted peptidase
MKLCNYGWAVCMAGMLVLAAAGGCNSGSAVLESTKGFPQGTGFQTFPLKVGGSDYKYSVFVPRDYSPQKKYPAIVFLHGVLEAGSDATKNVGVGIGPHVSESAATWPFITVFPQSGGDWQGEERDRLCMAALDDTARRCNVDPDRVILTGLSNGGQGVWLIGAAHKDRFAALVPVAGFSAYDACSKLKGIPIWCFHNSVDPFVPSSGSAEMCKRINDAGGSAKYTQFSGFGHDIWDKVYGNQELMKWMLAQRRPSATAVP